MSSHIQIKYEKKKKTPQILEPKLSFWHYMAKICQGINFF